MKAGVWFYGLGTALAGILDIAWEAFDPSHQPIQALGRNLPGQAVLACIAGVWLVASGLAMLWRRSASIGAAASAVAYLIFTTLWAIRYYTGLHALGWRLDVIFGVSFGVAQQLMLIAPVAIVYASAASPDSPMQRRAAIAARWMLGLPPVFFGLSHFIGIRVFAGIVPHWMSFGYFWAALTGLAFFLAGCAICSGIMDAPAAWLLGLMLLLFEGFVEIPPIFVRLHDQATWGAAVYNLAAIGACWMFAGSLAGRSSRKLPGRAGKIVMSRSDSVVA